MSSVMKKIYMATYLEQLKRSDNFRESGYFLEEYLNHVEKENRDLVKANANLRLEVENLKYKIGELEGKL